MLHKSNARVYKLKNCGNQTLWVDSALVAQCRVPRAIVYYTFSHFHYHFQVRSEPWRAPGAIINPTFTFSFFLSFLSLSFSLLLPG